MEYRLPADAIARLVRQRGLRITVTYAFMYAIVALVVAARGVDVPPLGLTVLAVVFMIMIITGIATTRKKAAALSITLSDDAIAMKLPGLLDSTVRRDEVTKIEERPAQGLAVHGREKRVVGVPVMIGGYDEIRAAVAQWHPIEPAAPNSGGMKQTLVVCGVLAGWAATYVLEDPRLVVPIGSAVVLFLLVSQVLIWRSKMLDVRYKRSMLLALVPTVAIAFRVFEVIAR